MRSHSAHVFAHIRRLQWADKARDNQILLLGLALLLITVIMGSLATGNGDDETPGDLQGGTATQSALGPTASAVGTTPARGTPTEAYPGAQRTAIGASPAPIGSPPYPTVSRSGTPISGFPTFAPNRTAQPGSEAYPDPGPSLPTPIGPPPGGFDPSQPGDFESPQPGDSESPQPGPAYPAPVDNQPPPTDDQPEQATSPARTFPTFPPPRSSTPRPQATTPPDSGGYPEPGDDPGDPEEPESPVSDAPSSTPRSTAGQAEPTATAVPTQMPDPTQTPAPTQTPVPPTPTSPPVRLLSGNVHWTSADSPVILDMDTVVDQGATLTIDPGVDVLAASGVKLIVSGRMVAGGNAGVPVEFVSGDGGLWGGIQVNEGGSAQIDGGQIRNAGSAGTAIVAQGGSLTLADSHVSDGAGGVVTYYSNLELRRTAITGNSLGDAALTAVLGANNALNLSGNSITANQSPKGSPAAKLVLEGHATLQVTGNLFTLNSPAGTDLAISSSQAYTANISCNTFYGGSVGLALNTSQPSLKNFAVTVSQNVVERHSTRGMAGDLAFEVTNNWWGHASGPFEAERNPDGQGDAVGVNLLFDPWLTSRPTCAP